MRLDLALLARPVIAPWSSVTVRLAKTAVATEKKQRQLSGRHQTPRMRVWILGHQATVRCQVARFLAASIARAAVPTDYACFPRHQTC